MAWIFLQGGLIMPSQAPMDEADEALTLGYRDIQVRARLVPHLEYFIRTYMTDLDYSEIELTPHMDYNARFYTTREDLAVAIGKAMMDIDYRKFKPTAERIDPTTGEPFVGGAKYHGVLNTIWGALLRLAPAGGTWGPRTEDNPNGYTSSGRTGRGVSFDDHYGDEPADAGWWDSVLSGEEPKRRERRRVTKAGRRKAAQKTA